MWLGHKRLVLWVLVTAEVQCQANAQRCPEGLINVQHPYLLALVGAPAPACPHEARTSDSQVTYRCSTKGAFCVG